tara:strand:+ start:2584 stop:2709 length:126 start_codon:yes stop_codon:yes gene_type:complete
MEMHPSFFIQKRYQSSIPLGELASADIQLKGCKKFEISWIE